MPDNDESSPGEESRGEELSEPLITFDESEIVESLQGTWKEFDLKTARNKLGDSIRLIGIASYDFGREAGVMECFLSDDGRIYVYANPEFSEQEGMSVEDYADFAGEVYGYSKIMNKKAERFTFCRIGSRFSLQGGEDIPAGTFYIRG